ncbi:MAG: DegT/DnrJ/EryC1/StrS family aminotransferase [candidate division WOR-3 bacterium]
MKLNRHSFGMLAGKTAARGERFERVTHADAPETENILPVRDANAALRVALFGLGLGPDCEVLVPAFGKHTPGPDVFSVGARPSYVDVGEDIVLNRGNLTRKLESEYRRENGVWVHKRRGWVLRGIVMTHPLGFSPFVNEVEEFAAEHGLVLVDDARGALGSRVWSASRSTWICAGSGGTVGVASSESASFLVSKDPELLMLVSMHVKTAEFYDMNAEAMKELRIAGAQARKSIGEILSRAGLGNVLETPNYCQSACREVLLIAEHDRDEAMDRLEEAGFIAESNFYPQAIMEACERQFGYRKGRCPDSEELARRAIAVRRK